MHKITFSFVGLFLGCVLSLVSPVPSYADESACAGTCPAGERTVSHADGDRTTCYCVAESEGMAATVSDSSVGEGEGADAGQSDISGPSEVVPGPQDQPDPSIS